MPISPARSKPIFSVWSRAKRRTPRPRSRAAPGGYKKSSASSSTSFRPPRNRNQPKPRLRSALVHCKHPLDLTDELAVPTRLLAAEIVGGETQNDKPLFAIAAVQRLEAFVLGRIPAFACRIDHEQHLPLELAQRCGLIGQARKGMVEQRRARSERGRRNRNSEQ